MSDSLIKPSDECANCGHWATQHVLTVAGVACKYVTSGVSTSGVSGIPWSQGCTCKDFKKGKFVPPPTETERARDRLAKALTVEGPSFGVGHIA